MKIQELEAKAGEKVSGYVKVENTEIFLPITLICGKKEGKTVLITAGVHNSEYVGIQTAIELANNIKTNEVLGNIIIMPLINRSGFEHRTMSLTYEDNKNLNREFPGKENGSVSEKITYFIETEIFKLCNYHIDLHCGDGYEELTPYVYCQGKASEDVKQISLKMAKAVNVNYIVKSQCDRGGAYNYAGTLGIPGILIERGCLGKWSKEEVIEYKKDVLNVLGVLKILDKENTTIVNHKVLENVIYVDSDYTGCWYPEYKVNETFKKGDILGVVKDYFGNVLHTCIAEVNGVVLYQVASLSVLKGGPMITYGEVY